MASPERVRGDLLLSIDKKAVGAILLLLAVGCFGGGIAGAVLGHYWTLALVGISPFLAWMAISLMAERLAVTTDGVYHICGKGAAQRPEVRAAATWEEIEAVELEVKKTRDSNNQTSTSYTLVFARTQGEPLRYLIGIPSETHLDALRRVCEERGIPASL